jgi:hypothetical protein
MSEPVFTPAPTPPPEPEPTSAEGSTMPHRAPKNIAEACGAIIATLDALDVDPQDYWRIFKAVRVLCDDTEDGLTNLQRGISRIAEAVESDPTGTFGTIMGMVMPIIMSRRDPSPPLETGVAGTPIDPSALPASAYVLAFLDESETIVETTISPTAFPENWDSTSTVRLLATSGTTYENAREHAVALYPVFYPRLAEKFPLLSDPAPTPAPAT